jgi:hypothetical protein
MDISDIIGVSILVASGAAMVAGLLRQFPVRLRRRG